jgi:hypothetical protein
VTGQISTVHEPKELLMKSQLIIISILAALLLPATARAQTYAVNWHKVSGGGGTSTNGTYSISGTIGQHDASGSMTGGGYAVTGGFWAIYAVYTPGLPVLNIRWAGPDSAIVFWLNTGSYTLQTNSDLNRTNWIDYGGAVTTANGTNNVTFTPPKGNLFFRLSSQP